MSGTVDYMDRNFAFPEHDTKPFDLEKELRKLDVPATIAELMADDLRERIMQRERFFKCACGTPCLNRFVHDAVDHLMLMRMEEIIAKETKVPTEATNA
jgi:hypothetical protein